MLQSGHVPPTLLRSHYCNPSERRPVALACLPNSSERLLVVGLLAAFLGSLSGNKKTHAHCVHV